MHEVTIKIHEIATDGLPDMEGMTGRVAFLWDGNILSGWPLEQPGCESGKLWECSAKGAGQHYGVTHWIELPSEAWNLHEFKEN